MPPSPPSEPRAGPSRKRSHADITRSASCSHSPSPPSKRRRILPDHPVPTHTPEPAAVGLERTRYIGDGLDLRYPIMSSGATPRPMIQDTIDLTDDTPPPPVLPDPALPVADDGEVDHAGRFRYRASPIRHDRLQPEVIDLSGLDDDDEDEIRDSRRDPSQTQWHQAVQASSSPDLVIVGERVRSPPLPQYAARDIGRTLPFSRTRFGGIGALLTSATAPMFRVLRFNQGHLDETALDRIDGFASNNGMRFTHHPTGDLTVYDNLEMNYGQTGFAVGADPPTQHPADREYKAPHPAPEGFTRTYDEDDMLICGLCGDELAVGANEDDIKGQVWVVKQCGHVYCGVCAHNRSTSKSGNKDRKRTADRSAPIFKHCAIPGCNKAVDNKKMFQIYL